MHKLDYYIFCLLFFVSNYGSSQVFMDSSAMNIIHTNKTAYEGDFYLDTVNDIYRIGFTNGELGYVSDNQDVDSIKFIGDSSIAIYLSNGDADTASLSPIYDSVRNMGEWIDGDSISKSNLVYARQALLNNDTIVFTDTGSLGIGTTAPTNSVDVAGGGIRLRNYTETRADDTSSYLNTLYTDANGHILSGRREIIPPTAFIDATLVSTGNTFNYYNHYSTQVTNAGLSTIAVGSLDFYVMSYDPAIFSNVSINGSGVLQYDIIATSDTKTFIDVRFFTK